MIQWSEYRLTKKDALKNFNYKKLIQPLVVAVILAAILTVAYLNHDKTSGFQDKSVHTSSLNYHVSFSKNSTQTTVKGTTVLEGKDPSGQANMILAVTKANDASRDCFAGTSGTTTVTVVSSPVIEGQKHNLCYAKTQNVYGMNFKHDGKWYVFTLFSKDGNSIINVSSAKTIAASVKID